MSFIVEELQQQQLINIIRYTGGVLTGLFIDIRAIIKQQQRQEIFDVS